MPLPLQSLLAFFAWLVLFSDTSKLQLAPSIRSHKLWCQARALLGCLWLPRCQHPNWFIIFLATLQLLDSGPQTHQITSPWLLLTGRLISLSWICWLVFVLLLMPLLTQSNSSPTSELSFLILFPLCQILREALSLCLKCVMYFSRFMTFRTQLFLNKLGTLLVF